MQHRFQVAVPVPLDGLFDYCCEGEKPGLGCRVQVPFQNRQLIGVVWSHDFNKELSLKKIKSTLKTIDSEPLFSLQQRKIFEKISVYYQHSLGEVVSAALTGNLKKGKDAGLEAESVYSLIGSFDEKNFSIKGEKQKVLLSLLKKNSIAITRENLKKEKISLQTIKTILQKEPNKVWISETTKIKIPGLIEGVQSDFPHQLNDEQKVVVNTFHENKNKFFPCLLQGVTGSGKTEVYLQIMESILVEKKQILLLVPEIGLAPQIVARVKRRFNANIGLLHSGMTDKERSQAWLAAKKGLVDIVIGTRSAVFTPLPNLGLIVVDEEHDLSFKQQDKLRYHARDVALLIAQQNQLPIILGSATPSLETLQNVQQQRFSRLQLTKRAGGSKPPRWQLIDLQKQPLREGLSKPLVDAIRSHLKQKKQVMLFLNRRGFSPALMCHDCGWLAECHRCDARYTLHQQPQKLICHHCDSQRRLPNSCSDCGGKELHPLGVGTERLEQTLKELFEDVPVIRVDRDSVRAKGSMENKLAEIKLGDPAILLGTQMLAKGHHFPAITLVAIIDADSMFFSSDFRAMERGAQLLVQVGGRAGRGVHEGTVMLQTLHPDHPLLQLLLARGYEGFAKAALIEREQASLPPFGFMALLRAEAHNQSQVENMLQQLMQLFSGNEKASLLGPIPAIMLKRQGRFRYQILIQSQQRSALHGQIKQIRQYLNSSIGRKLARNVRWSVDVDPQEMV